MARKIVVNPKVCFGKPYFDGTRIPVDMVLELLATGIEIKDIVKDYYPRLTTNDVKEAVKYASQVVKNEEVVVNIPRIGKLAAI
ncbi:MAG: hypothetical protein ACD_57C00311G0004 [uncultured bacterium]|uniref:Antitoxin n=1 Tax=Candidatus Woesebacteria bacterium RIFCSPHIGHO2_12_FULL_41_24 TaxID=1802510 RepID=A0A1F8AU28_9BACT|nr:MAG: hypothetical protein ACD_57C00311G0004 [uncultured bacterium]OGM14704.1 MAG: hypothetical protein A2W15_01940 [Candidatus Woesebacteria bacterium RBG_16_41_13]OGM29718.1 MAG: hypothetical protein A2873_02360 [Candidatus Woesebacteria bacterium RIFCSPHIGHO2_01_FULL_42_80]OGM35246.1 MAG: hypothetical protein A3D84_00440 [Candidatus Woesebacteria bacterium RIFCSPHIGHO2_02_FULL_42_20]OGM55140.1 MAG: hypothetical protein A3E44_04445 [Candidatus Woesebacteria bacterium RIFCSPHIGHO2_12_FULL_41